MDTGLKETLMVGAIIIVIILLLICSNKESFTPIAISGKSTWSNGANINTVKTGTLEVSALGNHVSTLISNMIDARVKTSIYPVGSVMIRHDSINPNTLPGLSGTTWEQLSSGKHLITGTSAGKTGGDSNTGLHVLTAAQIPGHTHSFSATTSNTGAHTHKLGYRLGGNYSGHWVVDPGTISNWYDGGVGSSGSHSHTISGTTGTNNSSTATGHTHTINPPFVTIVAWRRTA
jgi:hypothetical protein